MPTRMTRNAPSFMSTPACNMDTAVGAEAWPSGDHVWNGNTPASAPKPSHTNGNASIWVPCENFVFANVPMSNVVPPASLVAKTKEPADLEALLVRERNLLYVALTRARDEAFVFWSGTPSRFLGPVLETGGGGTA
mgnify:CR=1 FL=1